MPSGTPMEQSHIEKGETDVSLLGRIVREISNVWQDPLPRRPANRDPHEIDKFYVERYAPRKARHPSIEPTASRPHEIV